MLCGRLVALGDPRFDFAPLASQSHSLAAVCSAKCTASTTKPAIIFYGLGREGRLPLGSPLPLFCAYDAQDSPIEGIAGDDDAVELTEVKEE